MRKGLGKGRGCGYFNLAPFDRHIHQLSAKGISSYSPNRAMTVKASNIMTNSGSIPSLARDIATTEGKMWDELTANQHFEYFTKAEQLNAKANIQAPKNVPKKIKTPTVEILSKDEFDEKFKDDYAPDEQGYATTKIHPDGTAKIYLRDDGDYERDGKLIMHELKELEIFDDLVHNQGINSSIADELAHNMNPVKIQGVTDQYPLDPNN